MENTLRRRYIGRVTPREKLLRLIEDLPEQDIELILEFGKELVADEEPVPIPEAWKTFSDGTPQPDWLSMLRRQRAAH
jgi:hypothetical protein